MKQHSTSRGSALIVAMVAMIMAVTIAYSALSISTSHRKDLQRSAADLQARYAAEAGIHRGIQRIQSTLGRAFADPFQGLDNLLFVAGNTAQPQKVRAASDEPVLRNGRSYGTFSVSLDGVSRGNGRDITVRATGYFPDAQNFTTRHSMEVVVRVSKGTSEVFDFAYFVNNWAWLFANNITSNGNVGSNGQFDAATRSPTVNGITRYGDVVGSDLQNPASSGGIYSGWDIVNAGNVQGMGGAKANQYTFEEPIPMPNLNQLDLYEARALAHGSRIELGGQVDGLGNPAPNLPLCDAVLGDGAGEMNHLILVGTVAEPIVIDGPVVVRGDVIIKGVVKGQGAIFATGNVYIPDDLTYLNPPATTFPASDSEADTEAWLAANQGADFLALHANESIVMGDYLDYNWMTYMDTWLSHAMNPSVEDTGTDRIPGTAVGRDGIQGTGDDDILEDDSLWTVEYFSQEDFDLGLVPPGYQVGDVIPGSGEDVDGDGVFDDTLKVQDLFLKQPLDAAHFAGNLPAGITSYSDIASMNMTRVDGALYTNHAAALVTLATGQDFHFFGSLASRNESVIHGTNTLNFDYDRRLLGGGNATIRNFMPEVVKPLQVLAWRSLEPAVNVEHELVGAPGGVQP